PGPTSRTRARYRRGSRRSDIRNEKAGPKTRLVAHGIPSASLILGFRQPGARMAGHGFAEEGRQSFAMPVVVGTELRVADVKLPEPFVQFCRRRIEVLDPAMMTRHQRLDLVGLDRLVHDLRQQAGNLLAFLPDFRQLLLAQALQPPLRFRHAFAVQLLRLDRKSV